MPELETAPRAAEQPASDIEHGFVTWLDQTGDKAFPNTPPGVFVLNNHSPRLVDLGKGWYGDPVGRTVGTEFLHRGPSESLRETTLIGGPNGETALLSQAYPASSVSPVLVIRDPDGTITVPVAPAGPDEAAIAACLGQAAGNDDFDAVLDCLGLLDTGEGSLGSGLFPPGSGEVGQPDCDGSGIASGGGEGIYVPTSHEVLMWTGHAEESLEGEAYGPVSDEFVAAVESLLEAGDAWHDANGDLAIDPTSIEAQEALVDAATEFGKAVSKFVDAAHDLIDENYGPAEPLLGEEPPASDPRCEQQDTDSARGTLFSNSDFCPSRDLLQCLVEQMDPIRKITDGKCATVENPLGGMMLKCNDGEGDPLEVGPGGTTEPYADDPLKWTDPTSPPDYQGKTHVRYVDTLDLGHVLIGICAAGGCPRDPRGF